MRVSYATGCFCNKIIEGDPDHLAITSDAEFRLVIWEDDGKLHVLAHEEIVLVPPEN